MAYLPPEIIVVDFLRRRVTDPRSRIDTTSDSFTATDSQTEFQLTPTSGSRFSHIISVTVEGTAQTEWQDYYIDQEKQKVIFFTGITEGEAVVVNYGETTSNWIFPDSPNKKLSYTSFPRIRVGIISAPGARQGNYEAPVESAMRFQVDIYCKEKQDDQIFTIYSHVYTGAKLARYLSLKITEAFEEYEEDLFPALYGYEAVGMPRSPVWDDEYQAFKATTEFVLRGVDIGRVS